MHPLIEAATSQHLGPCTSDACLLSSNCARNVDQPMFSPISLYAAHGFLTHPLSSVFSVLSHLLISFVVPLRCPHGCFFPHCLPCQHSAWAPSPSHLSGLRVKAAHRAPIGKKKKEHNVDCLPRCILHDVFCNALMGSFAHLIERIWRTFAS